MTMKPYPYQRPCLNALRRVRTKGGNRALVVMATGLGKTVVAAFDVLAFIRKQPGRVLYVAEHEQILIQARSTFESVLGTSLSFGNLGPESRVADQNVVFSTFAYLLLHREKLSPTEFDYVIIDEAHHSMAPGRKKVVKYFEPRFLLGLTATPDRMDRLDIGELFGEPVFSLSIEEGLVRNLLCEVDYRLIADEIEGEIEKEGVNGLNRVFFIPRRDQQIAEIINGHLASIDNPRAIIFCAGKKHANRMARLLTGIGVVHDAVSKSESRRRISDFRNGNLRIVSAVNMLNEGFDVPEANVLVFLRSTESETVFLQQLGRGLRLHGSKKKLLVLDFVGRLDRLRMISRLLCEIRLHSPTGGQRYSDGVTEVVAMDFGRFEFSTKTGEILSLLEELQKAKARRTKEAIIEQYNNLATDLGHVPSYSEVLTAISLGKIASMRRIHSVFGGVKNLREAAGHGRLYLPADRDSIIGQYRRMAAKQGRPPSKQEIKSAPRSEIVSDSTIYEVFGSISNLKIAAGFA